MKTTVVVLILSGAVLLAASGIRAQQGGLAGKWVADGAAGVAQGNAQTTGPQGGLGGAGGGSGINGAMISQRGVFGQPFGGPFYPRVSTPKVAELDLTVDLVKEAVSGSINLHGEGKAKCGRVTIDEGRTNGQTLTFTTYRKINGSRIPTRWTGEIVAGALSLHTLDTLPCNSIAGADPYSGLNASLPPQSPAMLYRRGDMETRKPQKTPMGAEGRWWTADSGRVTAVAFTVAGKGQMTGTVNLCGDSEVRIEHGTVKGRTIEFETLSKTVAFKVRQLWTGNLMDDHTLTLASQLAPQCAYSSVSLHFQRGR